MIQEIKQSKPENDLEELQQAITQHSNPETYIELRNRRVQAGQSLIYDSSAHRGGPCPPIIDDPFPEVTAGIPEVDAADLDLPKLAGAIRHHGALIVRGLMAGDLTAELRDDIDRVFKEMNHRGSPTKTLNKGPARNPEQETGYTPGAEWLSTPKIESKYIPKTAIGASINKMGNVFTFLSPVVSQKLISFFNRINLKPLLRDYFADEPCLSFKKSVLRRVTPLEHADWHQDGAFMSEQIKSLNLWISLSDCGEGTNCPGIGLVPKRIDYILPETGKNGAVFDWSVSQKTVDEKFSDTPPVRPRFGAGDAVFFDHYNLHVTSVGPEYTMPRYAIETWFFASSYYAENQIPVAW